MKLILGICGLISSLYILGCILRLLDIIYLKLIKKENVKDEIKELNPFNFFSTIDYNEKGKKDIKHNKKYMGTALTFAIIVGALYMIIPYTPIGSEKIGSLFEKKNYNTYYYVSMFPYQSDSKNYKVIAEIRAQDKNYIIQKAYFPNGGYVTFNNFIFGLPNDSLKFDEKVYVEDDSGTEWEIQLLDEKPIPNKIKDLIN